MTRPSLLLLFLAFAPAAALAGTPVALRGHPAVHGPSITLADVFEGASGPGATLSLAPAPPAGQEAVLDAGRVQLVAHAAGFDWDNAQGLRRIIVDSTGQAPSAPASPESHAHRGRTQALVYARNIASGEIIGAADLQWSDDAVAPADAPGDPDQAIGKAARRPLRAGAAVQPGDLVAPRVIHRDDVIAVAFEDEGVTLTLQGKAMGDASVGQTLQVLNTQSKKVIDAVATGPGQAVVGPRAEAIKAAAFDPAQAPTLR